MRQVLTALSDGCFLHLVPGSKTVSVCQTYGHGEIVMRTTRMTVRRMQQAGWVKESIITEAGLSAIGR